MEKNAVLTSATFGMGWFWGPDARFGIEKGVVRTRVGYAGGTKENPTYRSMGDHTEVIQIDYDPQQISYEELLYIFWSNHSPEGRPWSRQYMSIVLYHDEDQEKITQAIKLMIENKKGQKIFTEVNPLKRFYLAETYHQKYYLQMRKELMAEFKGIYPDSMEFFNSTAAARVNGYVAGEGTTSKLEEEINLFGLSDKGRELLRKIVGNPRYALF